jgi:hypothetical protein
VAYGVAHHRQVLLASGAQRPLDVPDVRLGHQADDRRLRVQQALHLRILPDLHARFAGRAERDEQRVFEVELRSGTGEELGVLRHGARPPALDEAHAELVQQPRDGQLVGDRVADPLALRAVAERGVEDLVIHRGVLSAGAGRDQQKDPPQCGRSARRRRRQPAR